MSSLSLFASEPAPPEGQPSHEDVRDVAARVAAWQRRHGRRHLPWQDQHDPYRIWLSEIMLQQTQVVTVIDYYQRFLARFPELRDLADAPEDEVLRLWAGLGYYARARNLHRCAQVIRDHWGGQFPPDAERIATLPGIGRSTAAAIAAFAYGERSPILDGNVKRVFARYFGVHGPVASSRCDKALWRLAEAAVAEAPGDLDMAAYTQGLMDLGSGPCTRGKPDCASCPLAQGCHARQHGLQQVLPTPKPRKAQPERHCHMLVLSHRRAVLLARQPAPGIWGGLWSLPRYDDLDALRDACAARGLPAGGLDALPPLLHVFTHFRLHIQPWRLDAGAGHAPATAEGEAWIPAGELADSALPAPVKALLTTLYPPAAGNG